MRDERLQREKKKKRMKRALFTEVQYGPNYTIYTENIKCFFFLVSYLIFFFWLVLPINISLKYLIKLKLYLRDERNKFYFTLKI